MQLLLSWDVFSIYFLNAEMQAAEKKISWLWVYSLSWKSWSVGFALENFLYNLIYAIRVVSPAFCDTFPNIFFHFVAFD